MANEKQSKSDHGQNYPASILRNFALLALPWVSFQSDMLKILKKGIKDTSHVKPLQKLTLLELHGLMMILDPSRTWRSHVDGDFEKKIEETYNEIFPKILDSSTHFIEAQDTVLEHMHNALMTWKNGNKAKGHSK